MNLLNINGDHCNGQKTSMKVYKMLRKKLVEELDVQEIKLDDTSLELLKNCQGCKTCFKNGQCILEKKDDINGIRSKILESDLLVISTPVFVDNIPGNLKTLFDRLSYWFHTMPLIDKYCIIIISTYRSGIDRVSQYLYKIANHLGLEVVGLITIDNLTTESDIYQQIDVTIDCLLDRYIKKISCSKYKDLIFNMYDVAYSQTRYKGITNFESDYWFKRHYKTDN